MVYVKKSAKNKEFLCVENVIVEGMKLYHRCIGCKGQEKIVKESEQ